MMFFKIVACSFICLIVCLIIRQIKPEFVPAVMIGSVVCLIALCADGFKNIVSDYFDIVSGNDIITEEYTLILVKVLSLSVISKLASDFCRDCGLSVIASNIELIGKITILSFSFPIIKVIVELIQGLLV